MRSDLSKPYNDVLNPPDVNGGDEKKVLAWLVANGAPATFGVGILRIQTPMGEQDEQELMFRESDGSVWTDQFADVCNDPQEGLVDILRHFGKDTKTAPPYPVPPPPPPVVVKNPGTDPSDGPIGAYIPNTNGQYAIAYGWIAKLKNGQTITDPETGANFVVSKGFSPMGPTGYLQLQGA